MRDRLIELLKGAETKVTEMISTPLALEEWLGVYADYLLENGVIVPPCKYALATLDLLNRKDAEIDILIQKKDAAYDECAKLQAEVERLKNENIESRIVTPEEILFLMSLRNGDEDAIRQLQEDAERRLKLIDEALEGVDL